MNPINGISELIRMLRLSAQNKAASPKSPVRAHSQQTLAGGSAAQSQSIDHLAGKLRSRIQEAQAAGSHADPIDLFVEIVLDWKFGDLDGGLDLHKLAVQVKDILSSEPAIQAELKNLLDRL